MVSLSHIPCLMIGNKIYHKPIPLVILSWEVTIKHLTLKHIDWLSTKVLNISNFNKQSKGKIFLYVLSNYSSRSNNIISSILEIINVSLWLKINMVAAITIWRAYHAVSWIILLRNVSKLSFKRLYGSSIGDIFISLHNSKKLNITRNSQSTLK